MNGARPSRVGASSSARDRSCDGGYGRRRLKLAAPLLFAMLAVHCQVAPPRTTTATTAPVKLPAIVTGVNLRPVGDSRRGYGTRTARQTMERLTKLGANTIAVLMEGTMESRGDTDIRAPDKATLEATRSTLADANALGFTTVLIPHLVLEDGDWRGYIVFTNDAQRDAWWNAYDQFIDVAADLAASTGTTMLSVGVELKGLSKEPHTHARMRALGERVRRDYRGLLTYSANWDEAEDVSFWDVVDYAGVNGYYPLVPDPERGAEVIARRLTSLSELAKREVLVLEAGYRSSPASHERPWEWPDQVASVVDDASQANAWAAVLTHWLGARGVRGILVWIVSTDPDDPDAEPRHGFSPMNKPAEQVITRAFREANGAQKTGASE